MNKRQVITLWAIAIALGIAVTAVKVSQNQKTDSSTKRSPGQTLFDSFPASDVATIEIDGAEKETTIEKKGGHWAVAQRDDYPADNTMVNDFLRKLSELKITQGIEAGASFAPRFGMDESATKPEDHGITGTFKDASGKEIARVTIGKEIGGEESGGPVTGRFIRNHADESGFYASSEMFPSIGDDPQTWLSDEFIKVEKIKSIAVTEPGKSDIAWKLERATEEEEFKLDGAAPGETVDPAVGTPLKSLFAFSRFEDVVPADEVASKEQSDQKRSLTIQTMEGLTYNVTFAPAKPEPVPASQDPANPAPAPEEHYLFTVEVSGDLPKERKKEDGETAEQAKTKDDAFTERLKALTTKLENEKPFAGRTFEVSKFTVDPILKDRASLLKKDTPPAPPAASTNFPGSGPTPQAGPNPQPRGRVTAVTPPISIPPMDSEEDEEKSGD